MNKMISVTLALGVSFFILSCGKNSKGSSEITTLEQQAPPIDEANTDGNYQALFTTLNEHVNGTIPGSANFFRSGQKFYSYVRLFGGGASVWHMQNVYEGARCPTQSDDTNNDGNIDIVEAEVVLGKILVPLDADISTQSSGGRSFPVADLSGFYQYERLTSFNRFLEDLESEDRNPDDEYVKLQPGEQLQLTKRTVLVQGILESIALPDTVESNKSYAAFKTFPIACGVFQLVTVNPGRPYIRDEIPGPIADVLEDQDRPAEETQEAGTKQLIKIGT